MRFNLNLETNWTISKWNYDAYLFIRAYLWPRQTRHLPRTHNFKGLQMAMNNINNVKFIHLNVWSKGLFCLYLLCLALKPTTMAYLLFENIFPIYIDAKKHKYFIVIRGDKRPQKIFCLQPEYFKNRSCLFNNIIAIFVM